MKSAPLRTLIIVFISLLGGACRNHGPIRVQPVSHVGVGQVVRLSVYEEARPFHILRSAQASSGEPFVRTPVDPKWSVSDSTVASIDDDGTLAGHKPGVVT